MEYSVAVIALAFVALTVYAIRALKSARASLEEANRTTKLIQQKLDQLSEESIQLVRSTHRMTEDLQAKLNSTNSLFKAIGQTGDTVHQLTSSMKQLSASVSQSVSTDRAKGIDHRLQKVSEVIEWAGFAVRLLKKIKGR